MLVHSRSEHGVLMDSEMARLREIAISQLRSMEIDTDTLSIVICTKRNVCGHWIA